MVSAHGHNAKQGVVGCVMSSMPFDIHAFVTTRLDYCNALYVGVSGSSITRLQMVQNAAARHTYIWAHFPHFSLTALAAYSISDPF